MIFFVDKIKSIFGLKVSWEHSSNDSLPCYIYREENAQCTSATLSLQFFLSSFKNLILSTGIFLNAIREHSQ